MNDAEYVPAEALREALAIIDRLLDQQAMPDDFHVEPVARLRAVIDVEKQSGPTVTVPLADLLVVLRYMETVTPKHRQELLNALDRLGDITLKTRMGWAK